LVTDKLKSYAAAKVHIMPGVEHRQHKGLNNRVELSHQPTRQLERQMRRFKSSDHAQRFLSANGPINNVSGVSAMASQLRSTGTSALRHFLSGMRSPM
jgi:putative transposase